MSSPTDQELSTVVQPSLSSDVPASSERRAGSPLSGAATGFGLAAAAFANAITLTPLIAAWLYFTGAKYVEALTSGSGLPAASLEISDRAVTMFGFEIVLRSLNWFALLMMVGVALGILLGLIGVPFIALVRVVYRWTGGPVPNGSESLRRFVAWGAAAWASCVVLFVTYATYAAIFITPDRAACVGQQRFEQLHLRAGACEGCAKFGSKQRAAIPLLSGKEKSILLSQEGASIMTNDNMSPVALPRQNPPAISIEQAVDVCSQDANSRT